MTRHGARIELSRIERAKKINDVTALYLAGFRNPFLPRHIR